MKLIRRSLSTLIALSAAVCTFDAAADPLYRIESAQTIKSPTKPNWDYLAFDDAHSLLYISRREDGILVYDAKAKKLRGTLANTRGGNAVVLVPEFNRGYTINLDGSTTVFDLSTRKTLDRVKFGDDADNGFYDPVTKQIVVTMGDSQQVAFLDAKTGAPLGKLQIDSRKIEGTVPDGKGHVLVALRDRNKVVRIDMKEHKLVAEYGTVPSCEQPSGMAFDAATRRVFVGCRGVSPVLAAMDADSGRIVATTAIGRGNDIVLYDAEQRRIYTSNGVDANMVVIEQVDADTYKLVEATNTRPNARTMALDPKTKKVYLVAAEGAVDASKEWSRGVAPFYPNTYFNDTFTLLTLSRR
jgi:DNA-binding beta-propeller fold protein YncE